MDIDTSLDACSTFGLAPGALLHTAQVCALCGMPHVLLLTQVSALRLRVWGQRVCNRAKLQLSV